MVAMPFFLFEQGRPCSSAVSQDYTRLVVSVNVAAVTCQDSAMKKNVLVFPCGAENSLEIHAALSHSLHVRLWGASSVEDHGYLAFGNYIGGLPSISQTNFLPNFTDMLKKHSIDLVLPTHDTVTLFLAQNVGKLPSRLAAPGVDFCRLARYKSQLYARLAHLPFCPHVYVAGEDIPLPVFCKPDAGQGGKGTRLAHTRAELHKALAEPGMLAVEYLPGEEYTVDCFTDRHGSLLFTGPRSRDRVRAGIACSTRTQPCTSDILQIAHCLNRELTPRGLWFFQIKRDTSGQWKLLEISGRVASSMALYRQRGINFPLLTVLDALNYDVRILDNGFPLGMDRCLRNRYAVDMPFDTVYVDYDDTVTCDEGRNARPFAMLFLYRCARAGKNIVLLSRHAGDLYEDMRRLKIEPALFSRIVQLPPDSGKKSNVIAPGPAIFVDNHFPERLEVHTSCGIPVFDVDALELFLN